MARPFTDSPQTHTRKDCLVGGAFFLRRHTHLRKIGDSEEHGDVGGRGRDLPPVVRVVAANVGGGDVGRAVDDAAEAVGNRQHCAIRHQRASAVVGAGVCRDAGGELLKSANTVCSKQM